MNDSFVFYSSFYEAIEMLTDDEKLKAYQSIVKYGLTGVEPECNGVAKAIFLMAKPQIDANEKRRNDGAKGGAPKGNNNAKKQSKQPVVDFKNNLKQPVVEFENNPKQPNANVNVNDNANVNIKEKHSKECQKKSTAFHPPTQEEVQAYCEEKGYSLVDVERFIDFYESKGWYVGKNRMKDWKAAVRNWNRSQRQEVTAKGKQEKTTKNAFHNFEQRDIDFNDFEKQLDQLHFGGGA